MAIDDEDISDGEYLGPAMRALNERYRAFVRAVLQFPSAKGETLSRAAGFKNSAGGHRVNAHRLLHHDKVLAAIQEETWKRLKLGGLIGVSHLIRMAEDTEHPNHFRACEALADRAGYSAAMKVDVEVDDKRPKTAAARLARITELAGELGVDVTRLLGVNVSRESPKLIEHEATE